jgi:photosystem II stability/assembly factor-like uncharacterized protein
MRPIVVTILLAITLLLSADARAQQWEKLQEVSGNIVYVGFNRYSQASSLGFFSTMASQFELWRTSDAGDSWQKIDVPLNSPVVDMTWKDAMTGWMVTGLTQFGSTFKTTDGGLTWTKLSLSHPASGVVYVPATRRLFVSIWDDVTANDASYVSTDDGATWQVFHIFGLNGYSFSDGLNGMASVIWDKYIRTTNGGLTWEPLEWSLETWTPLAIKGTSTYFIASEANEAVYRSDDHGSTWEFVSVFPTDLLDISGDIRGDLCAMYVQASTKSDPKHSGIYLSTDEGVTWTNLGGPANFADTRFDIVGKTIFAGEARDFGDNTPRAVWRFKLPGDVGPLESTLEMEFDNGEKTITLNPDQRRTASIEFSSAIPAAYGVQSVALTLRFDASAASLENVRAGNGWSIASDQPVAGGRQFTINRTSANDVDTTAILTYELRPFFSLSENRTIMMKDVAIEAEGQGTLKCAIVTATGDQLDYDVSFNNCEDSLLLRMLDGRSPFEIVSLRPNPARQSQTIEIEYIAAANADATLSLIDLQGRTVAMTNTSMLQGDGRVAFGADVSAGSYTLAITSAGVTRTRTIVIR